MVLYAHQGGWDELALVGVPILLFGLLLWIANKRAGEMIETDDNEAD